MRACTGRLRIGTRPPRPLFDGLDERVVRRLGLDGQGAVGCERDGVKVSRPETLRQGRFRFEHLYADGGVVAGVFGELPEVLPVWRLGRREAGVAALVDVGR